MTYVVNIDHAKSECMTTLLVDAATRVRRGPYCHKLTHDGAKVHEPDRAREFAARTEAAQRYETCELECRRTMCVCEVHHSDPRELPIHVHRSLTTLPAP
jgi:hypothetical protein